MKQGQFRSWSYITKSTIKSKDIELAGMMQVAEQLANRGEVIKKDNTLFDTPSKAGKDQ